MLLLERWAVLESDWLREYGRDLNRDVFVLDMPWRRFASLWRGLGPNSLWRAIDEGGEKVITDDKQAERAFETLW